MQKQFITVLVALSLPVAGLVSACPDVAWAQGAKIAAGDANAGAQADGSSTPPSDLTKSNDAAAGDTGAKGDTSAPAASTGTGNGGDASLDSIWNENPAPTTKPKTKRKSFFKAKSSKPGNDAGATTSGAQGAGASAGSSNSPSAATSPPSADLAPSTSAVASPASSPPTSTTSAATTSAPASANPAPAAASPASQPAASGQASATSSSSTDFGYPSETPSNSAQPVKAATTTAPAAPSTPAAPGSDAPARSSTAAASTPAAAPAETARAAAAPSSQPAATTALSTSKLDEGVNAAPLCTTRTFFASELIRSVSWPGVGPFKGDTDPNDLSDPQENKLSLQTTGDKLTSAELFLQHQPNNPQGFINLQMVMDFMLEALGVRDKKINDFNNFLEKNKDKLLKREVTETKPLTTTNGSYLISIASSAPSAKEPSYLIQIKSKNATAEMVKSHTDPGRTLDDNQPLVKPPAETNNVIATSVPPTRKPAAAIDTSKPKTSKPPAATTAPTPTANSNATSTGASPSSPASTTANTAADTGKADSLKQEFADTIRSWQTIKKAAVRNQDASELSKVLSGKALDKQTVAIGWLVKKKDYYDLNPKGVIVDRYEELSQSPRRYAVYAQVREMSKLMDQTTGKQLSESDDQYNVKYTIEKSGDHWTIYDSDLIKSGTPATADQSKGKTKAKR